MATIPGSQLFDVNNTTPSTINIVETTDGNNDTNGDPLGSDTVSNDFNLEVFVGSYGSQPAINPNYQGYAVLSPSGHQIDLISGTFAVTDQGSGSDTLSAHGANETITGSASDTLNLYGTSETANGGSNDTITVYGADASISGGSSDLINVYNDNDTVSDHGTTGNETINVYGSNDSITANFFSGQDSITVVGDGDTIDAGIGADTITVYGSNDSIDGGEASPAITVYGNNDTISGVSLGDGTINTNGIDNTLNTGGSPGGGYPAGQTTFNISGANDTVVDSGSYYGDTIVGFNQGAGDRIHLTGSDTVTYALAHTTVINGGTQITLNDNSTIFLAGVTSINSSFFS